MSKMLSQEEIDALLSTVAGSAPRVPGNAGRPAAEGATRAVRYDFKHPNRVSKDQLRRLENIHDGLTGQLASALSTIQRSIVDIDLISVDQITYTEFISSLRSPSCSYTFRLAPLEGLCVMDFSPALAFAMVDRLFGGRGTALETERELTGIERSVMRKIVGRVADQLVLSWERVVKVTAEPVGFETNPQFIQIVPPGETVIVVAMQLRMPAAAGTLSICYPYVTLEGVMDQLSTQHWRDRTRSEGADNREQIARVIRRLPVAVEARLACTDLSLRAILELRPGTLLPLPVRVGDPVIVRVQDRDKFLGTVGTMGRRRAVQIEAAVATEGE